MPVRIQQVLDKVAQPGEDRAELERRVRDVIAALGLGVARDGEVYNPAPAPSRISEDNWRKSTRYPRGRYR